MRWLLFFILLCLDIFIHYELIGIYGWLITIAINMLTTLVGWLIFKLYNSHIDWARWTVLHKEMNKKARKKLFYQFGHAPTKVPEEHQGLVVFDIQILTAGIASVLILIPGLFSDLLAYILLFPWLSLSTQRKFALARMSK